MQENGIDRQTPFVQGQADPRESSLPPGLSREGRPLPPSFRHSGGFSHTLHVTIARARKHGAGDRGYAASRKEGGGDQIV
jgi:hypothetical protein